MLLQLFGTFREHCQLRQRWRKVSDRFVDRSLHVSRSHAHQDNLSLLELDESQADISRFSDYTGPLFEILLGDGHAQRPRNPVRTSEAMFISLD